MHQEDNKMAMREDVLAKRIYNKDDDGNPLENYEGMCHRVANAFAKSEQDRQDFFWVLYEQLFYPNSPALTNAGRPKFTASACFVLPVHDSITSIFQTLGYTATVHKMGGGTGFDFSHLRPAGTLVGTTKGVASGPISFMEIYDVATEKIKQGGTRRGANMGVLRVDHPDILQFIDCKTQEGKLKNFNLSVALTDTFMDAVKNDGHYDITFNGSNVKKVRARDVFAKIVENAWRNGEPGVLFIDVVNRQNPTPHIGTMETTNPCGEQPLLPFEACVLGSINLIKMVKGEKIDWELLEKVTRIAARFLDNIIDVQAYPIKEIEQMHKGNRKIGIGVMAWADMLIKLKTPYNSPGAITLAEQVMQHVTDSAVKASQELAEERGEFPNWKGSVWEERGIKVRNAAMTTIAPTGTLSIIAGVSSGIEPIFAYYTDTKRLDSTYKEWHPYIEEWAADNGMTLHVDKDGKVSTKSGAALPPYLVTTGDIAVEDHIRMLAAFQKHTHNAVSKTINMPNSATKEDVEKAILLAYEFGCKGLTVYRDKSRQEQVLSSAAAKVTAEISDIANLPTPRKIKIPIDAPARRILLNTAEGKIYVHPTIIDGRPWEVFMTTPTGGKSREIYDAFSRVLSVALRYGVPAEELLTQLEDANEDHGHISSIPAAIVRAFNICGIGRSTNGDNCPECGGILVREGGCNNCHTCGFTKCG
jgi:ribonucleoside-diphosphate reductase alpha chain